MCLRLSQAAQKFVAGRSLPTPGIDERMVKCKGHNIVRQYIKNMPGPPVKGEIQIMNDMWLKIWIHK